MDYTKLFKDKAAGKIDARMSIIFDNDGGYWECDTEDDSFNEKMQEEYKKKYGDPGGYRDTVDIMVAAGFNADWC